MQIIERENNFIIYQYRKLTHSLEQAHAAVYNYIYCISRLPNPSSAAPKKNPSSVFRAILDLNMAMLNYVIVLLLVTHISVTSESRLLILPSNSRQLLERSEFKEGREFAEFKSPEMKNPLNPTWHDPIHNDMNP